MAYRFFASTASPPPPSVGNIDYVTSLDAGLADRMKRNARRCYKKKRTTITLTILILVSQAPLLAPGDGNSDDDDDLVGLSNQDIHRLVSSPSFRLDALQRTTSFTSSLQKSPSVANLAPVASMSGAPAAAAAGSAGTSNNLAVGSPFAATRFIRSLTGGEPKISVFCTFPPAATADQVIGQIDAELRQFHHRRLLHPRDFYVLHPAFEGQGALDRSRRPLYGGAAPLVDGLGAFPFSPLALVPCVQATDRLQIEARTEPQLRMRVYHERLLLAQHLSRLSQLMREVANLAHSTVEQQWLPEWKQLKNAEIRCRTAILVRALMREEAARRSAFVWERERLCEVLAGYQDVQAFYDDCSFYLRRSNAAFEATRVIMARARLETLQRIASRERWERLVAFYAQLWAETRGRVRDFYTTSRLALEIETAAASAPAPVVVFSPRSGGEPSTAHAAHGNRGGGGGGSSPVASASVICTVSDSSLGATAHAAEVHRVKRKRLMAQEQDAILRRLERAVGGGSAARPSLFPSDTYQRYRSALCTPGVIAGDALASTYFRGGDDDDDG